MAQVLPRITTESKSTSVFAHDLIVTGDIQNQGDLRIEGQLHGNVLGHGTITVAEQGQVQGSIEGRHVVVIGRVEGSIKTTEKVEVLAKATVKGDVTSALISVEEGASVSAKIDTAVRDGASTLAKVDSAVGANVSPVAEK